MKVLLGVLLLLTGIASAQDRAVPKIEVDAIRLIAVERELIETKYKLAVVEFERTKLEFQYDYARLTREFHAKRDALLEKHKIDPQMEDVDLKTGKIIPLQGTSDGKR